MSLLCWSLQNATVDYEHKEPCGKLRCAVLLSPKSEADDKDDTVIGRGKSGFILISPSTEGPWTSVRLNYAAPAACWRLGNNVVASEVNLKDSNRYVNIRSLVSVRNNTDFRLDLCLVPKTSAEGLRSSKSGDLKMAGEEIQIDEFFETEKYNPTIGWIGVRPMESGSFHQVSCFFSCSSFFEQSQQEMLGHSSLLLSSPYLIRYKIITRFLSFIII